MIDKLRIQMFNLLIKESMAWKKLMIQGWN